MMDYLRLNPRHPVTQAMEGQWAKIVALLLYRDGVTETTIPPEIVAKAADDPKGLNVTIRFDDARGVVLGLVDTATAARLASEEGGLPLGLD